jgi:hypothetical protein
MRVAILYNQDFDLDDDPGREAREDVQNVAQALAEALGQTPFRPELVALGNRPLCRLEELLDRPPSTCASPWQATPAAKPSSPRCWTWQACPTRARGRSR